jgi:hypothetical protein
MIKTYIRCKAPATSPTETKTKGDTEDWVLLESVPSPEQRAQQLADHYQRDTKLQYSCIKNDFTVFHQEKIKKAKI